MSKKRNILIEAHSRNAVHPTEHGLPARSLQIDAQYGTVQMTAPETHPHGTHVARGQVEHAEIAALEAHPEVFRVWSDSEISLFGTTTKQSHMTTSGQQLPCPLPPCDCDFHDAKGTLADVAAYLGADKAWRNGVKGSGVTVGIVGGGITAEGRPISENDTGNPNWSGKLIPSVTNGWPQDWGTTGVALDWHGNAMATGVLGMAPDINIFDMRIVETAGPESSKGMISDALAAYHWGVDQFRTTGAPQVLNNSWGIYSAASAPDYATDPDHPFTRKVAEAIDAGMIVLFAAGNCGGTCPAQMCGTDTGPGHSIWGANGAPDVMCVVAANTLGQYVGYGSQGPAALDRRKPDFCGITHYTGYAECDYGTSSACAIATGVVALLKSAHPEAGQEPIKKSLEHSAAQIGGSGWNQYSGHGIIQVEAALTTLAGAACPSARESDAPTDRSVSAGRKPHRSPSA